MLLDVASVLGMAAEIQLGAPAIHPVSRIRHRRQMILTVWQRESVAEGAVWAQLNGMSPNGHLSARVSGSVNRQLCVHIEPEAAAGLHPAQWTGQRSRAGD